MAWHVLGVVEMPQAAVPKGFQPLSADEMQHLRERGRFDRSDGRFDLFKTTKKYDGDLGRVQHGFPRAVELPL